MKVRIELYESSELEIVIRTPSIDQEVLDIKELIERSHYKKLIFYKGNSEYFIKLDTILFFETDGGQIFAHTQGNSYEVRRKLYELEETLPFYFCRASKSTIINVKAIYALEKSFSGTSTVYFYDTAKQAHVSRYYYQLIKEKLSEVR